MRYSLSMDTFLRNNPGVLKDMTECDNGEGNGNADCANADDDGDGHCEAGISADKVIGVEEHNCKISSETVKTR